jgi:hypothetical protein
MINSATTRENTMDADKRAEIISYMISTMTAEQAIWALGWLADDGPEIQRAVVTAIALARDAVPGAA